MDTNEYRIERDFLGEKHVPADAYYGIQTVRAIENFPITGYPPHPALIQAFGYVKKAAAMANRDVGNLNKTLASAIIKAAEEVIEATTMTNLSLMPYKVEPERHLI